MGRKERIQKMDKEERRLAKRAQKLHKKEAKARTEKRGANSTSILRLVIVGITILIQIAVIIVLVLFVDNAFTIAYIIFRIFGIFIVLSLFGRDWNSAFKLPWIMFILNDPVVGLALYLMLGRRGTVGKKTKKRYALIREKIFKNYPQNEHILLKYKEKYPELYHQLYYLSNTGKYPCYQNTDVKYYSEGKYGLDAQIEELKKAEKFIFFEYHAIENQESFERIKKVLFEKAAQGVEVRVFYDDMGSIGFVNHKFKKEMIEHGVQCRVFNPLTPLMVFFMNNRDHRKITVIDGKVGFTGGYNMADEYFDVIHPFGEWKDTGIRLEGDAVNSLTLIFLENWNGIKDTDSEEDIKKYIVEYSYKAVESDSVILPYADGPVVSEPVAETAYLNLIRDAKHYVCITTPYLLVTDEMIRELTDAVKRGIDVRIITPGIPDKKIVYRMTRSYYIPLIKAGVKIYEYKPGFVHSKMIVVDDYMAVVGTINFDYRSLYHHFENACFFSGYECVKEIREDFNEMFKKSRNVREKYIDKKHLSFIDTILRLFAPLM